MGENATLAVVYATQNVNNGSFMAETVGMAAVGALFVVAIMALIGLLKFLFGSPNVPTEDPYFYPVDEQERDNQPMTEKTKNPLDRGRF